MVNAIKWGTIRDGRWAVLPKSCKGFSGPLYELMGWNKDCKYKLRGQFCGTADEQVMIFELEEPEVLVQEKAEEQFAEETEKKPEEAQKPFKNQIINQKLSTYVSFLNKMTGSDAECFRVPKYNPENWEFKISSVSMLRMIWKTCEWDAEKTYRLTGICHSEYNLVEFDMKQATMLTVEEF